MRRHFQRRLAEYPRRAFETRRPLAPGVGHVGQVIDAGVERRGVQVHRRLRSEVAETQGAVHHPHLVEGDRQQLVQLLAPVGAGTGLRGVAVAAGIDEVELRTLEDHPRHYCVIIPERLPAHRQVDARRVEERHRHLAVVLDDAQSVDPIRAAPERQVDVGDVPTVVAHVGQLAVQVVAHQVRQRQVQRQQQQKQRRQAAQGNGIAFLHRYGPPGQWTRAARRWFERVWTRGRGRNRLIDLSPCDKDTIMSRIFADNAQSIGNTPLVQINRIAPRGVTILAKIEGRNPGYSVKCRIGANMIWDAEASGRLKSGMTLVEPTSGNTGIGLAFVAAARGYKLILTMPASMSLERRKVLKALGAELVLTEPAKGMKGAIQKAEELVAGDPGKYFMPQQFDNPANPAIHEKTTGPEIWNDTEGAVDVLVSGVGTGGTLTGVSRYIKNTRGKPILAVAVEPVTSPVISQTLAGEEVKPAPHKIQGIGAGFVPKNLDLSLVDRVEKIGDDEAKNMALRLMQEEGILCGISSGAAMAAAVRLAEEPNMQGKTIVVILPDSGERYLSSMLFDGLFSEQELTQ
ncbi:Cysteine synthase A [Pseudomonas aeruginosa MH38]|nr:Cysteine synthase A [Pseudomonas aeruginosa MH38]